MAKEFTKADAVKAWSDKVGRQNQYDVREVEGAEGEHQVQLIDKDTGSITVAANGEGAEAYRKLVERVGDVTIDAAVMPKESVGPDNNKKHFTSRGQLATPTQPEALVGEAEQVEVNPKAETGREPEVNSSGTAKTAERKAETGKQPEAPKTDSTKVPVNGE